MLPWEWFENGFRIKREQSSYTPSPDQACFFQKKRSFVQIGCLIFVGSVPIFRDSEYRDTSADRYTLASTRQFFLA